MIANGMVQKRNRQEPTLMLTVAVALCIFVIIAMLTCIDVYLIQRLQKVMEIIEITHSAALYG